MKCIQTAVDGEMPLATAILIQDMTGVQHQ